MYLGLNIIIIKKKPDVFMYKKKHSPHKPVNGVAKIFRQSLQFDGLLYTFDSLKFDDNNNYNKNTRHQLQFIFIALRVDSDCVVWLPMTK